MTLKLEWGDEDKTFIYTRFHPGWTWQEFAANRQQYHEMVTSVSWRVDYVGDLRGVSLVPNNMIKYIQQATKDRLPNEGNYIIISGNIIIKQIVMYLSKILPVLPETLLMVETLDEARELVTQEREQQVSNR